MRRWSASDQEGVARRKDREEVRRFTVEHGHGALRGKCTGELAVSGLNVEYKGSDKEHSFRVPFASLKIVQSGEKVDFVETKGKEHRNFKLGNASQGRSFASLWSKLQSLSR